MNDVVWSPDRKTLDSAQLTRFLAFTGHDDFGALHRFSVENIPEFTTKVLEFLRLQFQQPFTKVLDISRGEPWAKWCVDGILNISDSCLQHDPDRPAVIWEGEE